MFVSLKLRYSTYTQIWCHTADFCLAIFIESSCLVGSMNHLTCVYGLEKKQKNHVEKYVILHWYKSEIHKLKINSFGANKLSNIGEEKQKSFIGLDGICSDDMESIFLNLIKAQDA